MMKTTILKTTTVSCFFILLFAQLLPGSALELTHALRDTSLDIPRDIKIGQERYGSRSCVDLKADDDGEDFKSRNSMADRKAQKGKGSYGGANIVHRPPEARSLAPPTLMSSTVVYFSFILLLVSIA